MSTTTLPAIDQPTPQGAAALHDVSWGFYERFLEEIADQRMPHSFVNGELLLMSPGARHESLKEWLTYLVAALTEELGLPRRSIGSTTLKLSTPNMGAEPDAGFLIANAGALSGKQEWNAETDPPPDLLVEVDIASSSLNRMPVYAALGVPEVWVYDGQSLSVRLLEEDLYRESESSISFPTLPLAEFAPWIEKAWETDESAWLRSFREWVRNHVAQQ